MVKEQLKALASFLGEARKESVAEALPGINGAIIS